MISDKAIDINNYFNKLEILIDKGEEFAIQNYISHYYPIMTCIDPIFGKPKVVISDDLADLT